MFFNPNSTGSDHQHINTALSVAQDDVGRFWVYFGTGRFWSTLDREAPYFSYQNAFYGIKEPVDASGNMTYATVGAKATTLKNVSSIEITDQDNTSFSTLMNDITSSYSGWYRNFATSGERNLGQAAILGDIVTFSTFVPDNDLCASEGESYLYALHYKTGTAYWKGVLLTKDYPGGIDAANKVVYRIRAGKGYSTTPNIHSGKEKGSRSFLQTSTGAIISIAQENPGITKSGGVYWRESSEN
ncbi:MAG: hypothetical protein J7L57_00710 [Deltaproteobacteria bacterium]|nr:hypothetical protein [Candidatus Tharpella sp.]